MRDVVVYNYFAMVTFNFGGFIVGMFLLLIAGQIGELRTRDRFILASAIPSSLQILIVGYHSYPALPLLVILAILQFAWAKYIYSKPIVAEGDVDRRH